MPCFSYNVISYHPTAVVRTGTSSVMYREAKEAASFVGQADTPSGSRPHFCHLAPCLIPGPRVCSFSTRRLGLDKPTGLTVLEELALKYWPWISGISLPTSSQAPPYQTAAIAASARSPSSPSPWMWYTSPFPTVSTGCVSLLPGEGTQRPIHPISVGS